MPGPYSGGTAPIVATSGADYQAELPNVSSYSEAQHRAALVRVLGTPDRKVGFSLPRSDAWENTPYRGAVLDLWYGNGDVASLVGDLVALVRGGTKSREKVYNDLSTVESYGVYRRDSNDPAGIGRTLRQVFSDAIEGRSTYDLQAAAAALPGDLQIGRAAGPLPGLGAGAIGAVRPGISAEGSAGEDINLSSEDGVMDGILDSEYAPYIVGGLVLAVLVAVYVWWVR